MVGLFAQIIMREGEEKLIDVPPEKGYTDKGRRCYGRPLKIKLKLLQQIKPYHIAELHC